MSRASASQHTRAHLHQLHVVVAGLAVRHDCHIPLRHRGALQVRALQGPCAVRLQAPGMEQEGMQSGGMQSGGMEQEGMQSGGMQSGGMEQEGMQSGGRREGGVACCERAGLTLQRHAALECAQSGVPAGLLPCEAVCTEQGIKHGQEWAGGAATFPTGLHIKLGQLQRPCSDLALRHAPNKKQAAEH